MLTFLNFTYKDRLKKYSTEPGIEFLAKTGWKKPLGPAVMSTVL